MVVAEGQRSGRSLGTMSCFWILKMYRKLEQSGEKTKRSSPLQRLLLVTCSTGCYTSHGYCEVVYTCWIFLGSHLNRVLHSFWPFAFDFVMFFEMAFRSRVKVSGWGMCTEELFPLAEWLRTSVKCFSCRLKSYSTLHKQTDQIFTPRNKVMTQDRRDEIQPFPKKTKRDA